MRGPVLAGLVLGAVGLAGVAVLVAGEWRAETGVFELAAGDCVNGLSDADAAQGYVSTPVVPCSEPHEAEVITSFDLAGGAYPGGEAVVAEAERRCAEEMLAVLDGAAAGGVLMPFYFYPTAESWERLGDRTVHCLAMPPAGATTGSLLDR